MLNLMKKIIVVYVLLPFIVFAQGKGTLIVRTQILPIGTTKKYNTSKNLILDAGVLNSKSDTQKLRIATVYVRMITQKTENGDDPTGIAGDFNLPFKLNQFESKLNNQPISMGELVKYKNGQRINIQLYAENFRIVERDVFDDNTSTDAQFVFVAYPEEAKDKGASNLVIGLSYTFDLYLDIKGAEVGDIVRKDVTTGMGIGTELDAVGHLKDIIKDQFRILQQ